MLSRVPAHNFYTLGYEGHTLPTMMRLLLANNVSLLIDVRQNPVSRKRGFSRTCLERSVPEFGVAYLHCPQLGTPPVIRTIYMKTGNIKRALIQYEKHLRMQMKFLQSFFLKVRSQRFCLLCLESDHNSCHRGVIAQVLTEMTGCQPIHLE